jgi:hypothetical protein
LRELPVLREDALQGASRGGFQRELPWDVCGIRKQGSGRTVIRLPRFRKSRMREGVGGKA